MDNNEKKDFILDDKREFGEMQVHRALDDLRDYVAGKYSVDAKATANQEWWRLRHWNVIAAEHNEGTEAGTEVGSAWAVNSLLNKHADIMDSFPKPNILPREVDDEAEAQILTHIVPTVLEENDYEQVFRQMGWDLCIDGAAITGVFWDSSKHDGMGDVAINNIDVHNLFWKPGIQDIQESDKVFYVTLEDVDTLKKKWPKIADKIGPQNTGYIGKYINDDNIDTSNCAEVVNLYYKKPTTIPVFMPGVDENGQPTQIKIHDIPKMVLHFAIIIGDQVAFASENEPGYENGFYEHGQFPFIIRRLLPIKDTPWGFGYLDIMKHPQKDIDKLDQAIIKNALMKAKPRYWAKKNANINIDDFADWTQEIVEVGTGDLAEAVRRIDTEDVPSGAMNHLANKIEELKETSGNRDFSQGSTASGVTAASAIAALQEAGSKLSRDVNKEIYRGCREEYYLVIELIRQFYSEPRSFRVEANTADAMNKPEENRGYEILGGGGDYRFILYSNAGIVPQDMIMPDGTVRHKRPLFDIMVSAEKQSPFSRAAQNELVKELYGMGLFAPENDIAALVCIDAMDFEGKDKLKQQIEENGMMTRQFQAAMQMIQNLAMMDPGIAQMAMQQGLIDPEQMMAQQQQMAQQQRPPKEGTPEERVQKTGNSYADKIRKRSLDAATPQ